MSRTGCAEDKIQLLVLAVFRLDARLCESLDRARDEVDLSSRHLYQFTQMI